MLIIMFMFLLVLLVAMDPLFLAFLDPLPKDSLPWFLVSTWVICLDLPSTVHKQLNLWTFCLSSLWFVLPLSSTYHTYLVILVCSVTLESSGPSSPAKQKRKVSLAISLPTNFFWLLLTISPFLLLPPVYLLVHFPIKHFHFTHCLGLLVFSLCSGCHKILLNGIFVFQLTWYQDEEMTPEGLNIKKNSLKQASCGRWVGIISVDHKRKKKIK